MEKMSVEGKIMGNCVLVENITEKSVVFITTKNIDYIRNTQEIRLLRKKNTVDCIASKSKNYLIRILSVYFKLLKLNINKYEVVFIGFAPQFILPLWKMKFRNKIIIIDFFISFYDTLVFDRKKIRDNTFLARRMKKIDMITLKYANHVISDTKVHGDYFINELNLNKKKLETIYLEADKLIYYPRIQNKRQDLVDKFIILYFGSILPLQGIDVVLKAINYFVENVQTHFQIIGPIPTNMIKPQSNNIEYIPWLEQGMLADYIANADLCLAGHFSKNIEKANRTIPGKAYIYQMMKRKMILSDSEANEELFTENDKGVQFVRRGNAEDLREAIQDNYECWITNKYYCTNI